MLILSRRPDEAIRIGEDVVLTVLEVKGKAVRIGVDAPRDVRVDRAEVAERRRAEADTQEGDDTSPK